MRIGLFIKHQVVDSEFEANLIKRLESKGHIFDNENPELVFSIGGDGTFLKATHLYLDKLDKVVFACINKGQLGYFSDFFVEDIDDILDNFNSFVVILDKQLYE